jgi:hypothetical protein
MRSFYSARQRNPLLWGDQMGLAHFKAIDSFEQGPEDDCDG